MTGSTGPSVVISMSGCWSNVSWVIATSALSPGLGRLGGLSSSQHVTYCPQRIWYLGILSPSLLDRIMHRSQLGECVCV